MRDCSNAEVRDRLPELVHGRLEGTELSAVESHVAECPDCAAEAALIRLVSGSAAAAVPKMNAVRIAGVLPAPPSLVQTRHAPAFGSRTLRWAAGFVLAVLGVGAIQLFSRSEESSVASRSLPAVAEDRAVTRPVSGRVDEPSYAVGPMRNGLVLVGGIDALSLDQLQSLVSGVESLSEVPAVEPDPLPLSVGEDIR